MNFEEEDAVVEKFSADNPFAEGAAVEAAIAKVEEAKAREAEMKEEKAAKAMIAAMKGPADTQNKPSEEIAESRMVRPEVVELVEREAGDNLHRTSCRTNGREAEESDCSSDETNSEDAELLQMIDQNDAKFEYTLDDILEPCDVDVEDGLDRVAVGEVKGLLKDPLLSDEALAPRARSGSSQENLFLYQH